jgi:glycosidase
MRIKLFVLFFCYSIVSNAQLLQWSPVFIKESSTTITITCDANKGNQGLLNYTPTNDVYVHIGAITNLSTGAADWKYVVNSNFSVPVPIVQTTNAGSNKWTFTINGGLRSFFNITNAAEKIQKIAILFRSGNGSKVLRNSDASDMYIPVYDDALYARIDSPLTQPLFKPIPQTITYSVGDKIPVIAVSSKAASLKIFFNGNPINTATAATKINADATVASSGTQTIISEANDGISTARDTMSFLVSGTVNVSPLPVGLKDGINYESGVNSATLVLFAPGKTKVAVLGDFNNWTETLASQMNRTPDGNRFWLRITGLISGKEYAYQYFVDGAIKIADYYTEKVLDPSNDPFIPASTYPNLLAYPTGKTTGIVSILQTAKPAFNWQVSNFQRPDKKNLVIYELLIRDFVANQNFQTLKDTISYFKRLGVNAIEIMPFNEFEGNLSWGYNPNFFLAPDKFYGTETAIRQFVDACHQQGIAVIMDLVMNHCMGSAPQAQLYWDGVNNRPAANNPWLNPVATHPYNVGNDFNHESQATKDLVARVVRHWLTQYKIDGFRWDLSKGFTQVNNPTDVNAWSNYDASRIAIWKRIYDTMQVVSPNAYCILEHFGSNTEEIELSNYGMLLWGNGNYSFNQATMGYNSGADFSGSIAKSRGWTNPYLVAYQESHDEERLQYKNINFGNSTASYNIKDSTIGLKRNEMAAAFWAMIPGPKMLWQFGEIGYPYSINTCKDLSVDAAGGCRLELKPIRWDYLNQAPKKALFDVYAKLFKLKLTANYKTTFTSNNVTWNLTGNFKSLQINDDSLKVVVIGNFDVINQTGTVTFPSDGNWYSYLSNNIKTATGVAEQISLNTGEYYIYTNKNLNSEIVTALNNIPDTNSELQISISPNPVQTIANVRYHLPENAQVKIFITDLQGRNINTMSQGFKTAGDQSFNFQLNQLGNSVTPNGIYILRINYNKKTNLQKFLIMK